jgi:hypothetical protein
MTAEREKYYHLLQLARDQIRALETDDMREVDRIMGARDCVIRSFGCARGLVELDPALPSVAQQIRDCDKAAATMLDQKLARVKCDMAKLSRYRTARSAYRELASPAGGPASGLATEVPRFIDRKL